MGGGEERKMESHGRSAWKLNGVPFPCRDCHFRFLYLYKSQSKPKIHAEHEERCVYSVVALGAPPLLWQSKS